MRKNSKWGSGIDLSFDLKKEDIIYRIRILKT
jgi:hypothetical protein